ncbi:translocation/assembly module TamB [Aureitalea sp. L0-47]|uniref:translocation/assembly module TamB domain-containing protein n=1 Tax=Aureitalea sp. L0-47 TaxID=2816962 RepID=UPI002238E2FE|nr:translocation/assembly module TamB domain-containing protein [Aureitalea sp. L0-47]MCW5519347.1 translocation/assembly module TamB [Aureitalea sp. L0-47]
MLLLLTVIILSIPAVQTKIGKKVTEDLNETYGTNINIERIGLNWKGEVDIREVYIADHYNDTLIYAKQLQTDILSVPNLIKGKLEFGEVKLKDSKLYIKTYRDEQDDNLYIFTEKFNTGEPSTEPFFLLSNDIALLNTRVKITDENLDEPEILTLDNIFLKARDFNIDGEDITAEIMALSMLTDFGVPLENLSANFSYNNERMQFKDMELDTGESLVTGTVVFDYAKSGMSDFNNNVIITAQLKNATIATNDLNDFYNEFGPNQIIKVSGDLKGTLNDFTFMNVDLRTGLSIVRGNFYFKDLLKKQDDFTIIMRNHNIVSDYYDLRRLMPRILGDILPMEIKPLGRFTFNGNTTVTQSELETKSSLSSRIGSLETSFKMGNTIDIENAYYKGEVLLKKFDLGKIMGSESVGEVTANLNFNGRGFTQETVDTQIEGTIRSFGLEGYRYQNISVSGNLKNPLFDGDLVINDPNLQMEFRGLVDVSKEFNQYDFRADVEFAELNKLNLFKRDSISVFAGSIIMDMDGTTINDAEGTIEFIQSFYQNEDDDFFFDDFLITSSFEGSVRTIRIQSPDIVDGKIEGEFLIEDVPNLFRNGVGSIYANYIPNEVTENQYIDYEFEVYNKLVEVFVPQLKLGENTRLRGSVSSDESEFKLDFRSPEILALENYLGKVNIQVDNDNPLYNTYISIDSIDTGKYQVSDINVINKTLLDTLYIRSRFKGGKKKRDLFNFSLYHTINPEGKSVVGVKRSDITYKDNVWLINKNNNKLNKISFSENFKYIKVDSLVLNHDEEYIRFAGVVQDSAYKNLKLEFQNVNFGNIAPDIDSLDLEGLVNGRLNFIQKRGLYYPSSNVAIEDVKVNDIDFGDLSLKISGNEDLTKYYINSTLINENVKNISAVGEIDVAPETPQIGLDVDFERFNLQAFSPFGGDVITDIRGYVTGSAKVVGNYQSPAILGRLILEESGLKIPYLNTDFDLADNTQIIVTKDKFDLGRTTITDTKYNTSGILEGFATHRKFGDWELDLNISTDRLIALDTPPDDEALYYGTAFISGTADIKGPAEELVIDVVATTEEGTTFKIPLSDTESIGDDSFIKFLSPEEKAARISGETIVSEEVKGLSLNFELDINKNAEVEVVVDQENNSRLKGRGAGILLLEINTLGKFRMWGDFLVIEGTYDFRYGGIVQKTFTVEPGGNITWDGKPERANLDLTAKYETTANPSILLDNPSVNRKIDVEVLIGLTGELIQPDINFEIGFPGASSIVRSELEYKLQNAEQREKQALFLLASNSFVNDNLQGSGAFSNTVAQSVSSLVNDIFAGQDSKFKVGLDYTPGQRTPDQDIADQVGITLTTQINDRIIINGKVGVPVGGVNESTVAGDIEVQWLVNEDGTLRINFFNRQADIQFIGEDQIFEQGAGLSYSVDFDTFSELIYKLFNRKVELESGESLPVTPDDNSIPDEFNNNAIKENEN